MSLCIWAFFVYLCFSCIGQLPLQRFTFAQPQMGTTFKIIIYAENESVAQNAADSAYARIEALNQIMSDYLPESELNVLSKTHNEWVKVSPDLWNVLLQARQISKYTRGAFDVSVGPIVRLWRRARRKQVLPDSIRLQNALTSVNYKFIKLYRNKQSVLLRKPNMRLDLGGIAKGYAVDKAMEILQNMGIQSALVDGGGDMRGSNPPPDKEGWIIGLSRSMNQKILLENRSIATSGDIYQFIELGGIRYSHIVNPHTGIGLTDQREVTVLAPDAATADALASAFSVLSPRKCANLLRKYPDVYYRILRNENGVVKSYISDGFNPIPNH